MASQAVKRVTALDIPEIGTAIDETATRVPKPETGSNPYLAARREWDERYGDLISRARNWRLAAFLALGIPYRMSWPAVSDSGRTIVGGFGTNSGYMSITVALGLYHASHVAEIVRGSILAVPRGQSEAANALALSGFQRYRFVILPQAAKIASPPIISQFLSLTKNTSLATVVAYPEIASLTASAIANGFPAVQMLVLLMGLYLMISLTWSLILNLVSRRFKEVGR